MRFAFRLNCHLLTALFVLTLSTFNPAPVTANPIPLPADNVWSLNLNSEPLPDFLVWEANGAINVLLGLDDRIILVRNGEVVQTSNPFNGEVTALLRADVMGEERPEFLVAVKEDSLNLIHILDGEDFSNLRTITVGWDWRYSDENPDSMYSESWEEVTEEMHWVGGEEGVLLIGKETYRENSMAFGGNMSKQGQILRYSVPNDTLLSVIRSGYDQYWSVVDGDFVVGSSSWWATWEPVHYGYISFIAQRFSSDMSVHRSKTMEISAFEFPAEANNAQTASCTIRMQDESPLLVASVDSRYIDLEPSTSLRIFDATNLDSLTSIDLNLRPIKSFVPIQNQEGDHHQPYLMCIEEDGTTRLLSILTLSLLAQEYISPLGGIGVKGGDFDGDGVTELIGLENNRLTCVRLRPLSTFDDSFILHPSTFSLSAFPNPFNSSTTISYSIPVSGWTRMDVVDMNGRLVTRLSDGWREAGSYREVFQGNGLASGQYVIKLNSDTESFSIPITIIK